MPPCVGVHKRTWLLSSYLHLQQCPAWIVCETEGKWPSIFQLCMDLPRAMDDSGGWTERDKERQGPPCYQHDLMMMIYIYIHMPLV